MWWQKKLRGGWVSIVLLLSLSLAACASGGGDVVPTEVPPTLTPTSTPSQPQIPLEIEPPVWTTGIDPADGSPVDTVEWFPTDSSVIYAAFETSEIAAGISFTISWAMNGVPVPGLNPTLEMTANTPAGWIEIHLNRTSDLPWPEGTLTIELKVGTDIVSTGSIELRDR